jgi:hypothetical protein
MLRVDNISNTPDTMKPYRSIPSAVSLLLVLLGVVCSRGTATNVPVILPAAGRDSIPFSRSPINPTAELRAQVPSNVRVDWELTLEEGWHAPVVLGVPAPAAFNNPCSTPTNPCGATAGRRCCFTGPKCADGLYCFITPGGVSQTGSLSTIAPTGRTGLEMAGEGECRECGRVGQECCPLKELRFGCFTEYSAFLDNLFTPRTSRKRFTRGSCSDGSVCSSTAGRCVPA